jgi:GTP-binding protein HflX
VLREALVQRLGLRRVSGALRLAPGAGKLRARLHALGAIRTETHDADGWQLEVDLPLADAVRLAAGPGGHVLDPLMPPADPDDSL